MDELQALAHAIAAGAMGSGRAVAAAESVTAGSIASALAAAPDASDWFQGSVVAYGTSVKRQVLGVTAGLIVSAECASEMVAGALRVLGADVAVATTGVGGPDPQEGRPAGTVVICAGTRDDLRIFEHVFAGEPADVVRQASLHALRHLADAVTIPTKGTLR